jgi:Sulfotransferase family
MEQQIAGAGFNLSDNEDRLVWIFGSSRSGSTWLLRMLSEIDGAVPIDDPHLGHHLGVWRPIPLAWATADSPPELTTLTEVKRNRRSYFLSDRYRDAWAPALRHLIVTRFEAQASEVLAARRWPAAPPLVIVKEPGSQAADLVLSLFPKSRMIFLLRDGRDVVDSWMAAHRPGTWALAEGAFAVAPEGRESLIRWQAAVWAYRTAVVQRAYRAHDPSRRLMVRYEDMLRAPARELRRVCESLGMEVPPQRLERIGREHAFSSVPRHERGADKPIRSARPGGWRRHLTRTEQQAMHEALAEQLAEVGYLPARPANGLPEGADGKPKLKTLLERAIAAARAAKLAVDDEGLERAK